MTPEFIYALRASQRLGQILDESGYPRELLGRSLALADAFHISAQEATQLLSGQVPWSWNNIARACSAFGRTPGFFLNEIFDLSIPSDVQIVTSVQGGESVVWRSIVNTTRTPFSPTARLSYLQLESPENPITTCLKVFDNKTIESHELTEHAQYVVETEDGYEIGKFKGFKNHFALFESLNRNTSWLIQVPAANEPANEKRPRIIGVVIGNIQMY